MENFVQYLTKDQKKVHYRELVKDGDAYKVSLPITEDHVVSAVFINGKRKTSTILKPVEQALCTGLMTINLIQDNEYHSLNRPLEFKEEELMDFNAGVGGVQEIVTECSYPTETVYTASSNAGLSHLPGHAEFNVNGHSWAAHGSQLNTNQWLDIDLINDEKVCAIETKGRETADQWVTQYELLTSNDGVTYESAGIYEGNIDRDSIVRHDLEITCRHLRIRPLTWNGHISMRANVRIEKEVFTSYDPRISITGRDQIDFNFTGDNFINIPMETGLSGFIRLHQYGLYRIIQFFVTFNVEYFEYGGQIVSGENLRNVNYGGQFALVYLGTSLGYLSLYINNGINTMGLLGKDYDSERKIPSGTSFISSIILPPE